MKTVYTVILGCVAPFIGFSELSAHSCRSTNVSFSLGCAPVCAPVVCAPVCQSVCEPVCVNTCNPCYDYDYYYCYTPRYRYCPPPPCRTTYRTTTHYMTYNAPRGLCQRGNIQDLFNWNCNGSNACGLHNSNRSGMVQSIILSQDNASYRCNGERKICLNMQFNLNNNNWQSCRLQEQLTNLCCNLRERLCCESSICNNCGNVQFSTVIDYGDLEILAGCLKAFSNCANLPCEACNFFEALNSECCRYHDQYCYNEHRMNVYSINDRCH